MNFLPAIIILEHGKIIKCMEKEKILGLMVLIMKVIMHTERKMDMVKSYGRKIAFMKDNFKMIIVMVKDINNGKMEDNIKVRIRIIK